MRICVEGLDVTGKTTVARYLSDRLGLHYHKIKKGVSSEGPQQEVTQRIIDEISEKLGAWSGVLDRGHLSAIASGQMYEPGLDWERIICPANLIPDITVLMLSSQEVALRRKKEFTKQDLIVLHGAQYGSVQDRLVSTARNSYVVVQNLSDSLETLLSDIEKDVIPKIAVHTA